jgi:hypothetical protein
MGGWDMCAKWRKCGWDAEWYLNFNGWGLDWGLVLLIDILYFFLFFFSLAFKSYPWSWWVVGWAGESWLV